jgi:type IV pilus assembly protein PilM
MDWGGQSVKYLLLRRIGSRLRVESFGRAQIRQKTEGSDENTGHVLSRIFSQNKQFKKAKTVVGLDNANLVVKRENFPALNKKELQQSVFFSVQRELNKENEESSITYDFISIGPDLHAPGNTEYLVFGATDEFVMEKTALLMNEKIVPAKLIPTIMALRNLLPHLPAVPPGEAVGFLDIGSQKSLLAFYKQGHVDFFREIVVGGDDFSRAITGTVFHEGRAIQFSYEEAQVFKNKYGYPLGYSEGMMYRGAPLTEVGTMMRPVMERLTGEVHRSIGFYRDKAGGQKISTLYLIGGGAKLKHLPEVLSEKIEIPVSLTPFPPNVRVAGGKEQEKAFQGRFYEHALCLSLALESSVNGNLLPKAFQKIHRVSVIQKNVNLALFVGVLTALVFHYFTHGTLSSLKTRIVSMEKKAAESKNNVRRYDACFNERETLSAALTRINQKLVQDETPIQVLKLISQKLPRDLRLTNVSIGYEPGWVGNEVKTLLAAFGEKQTGNEPRQKSGGQPEGALAAERTIVDIRGASKASIPDVRISVAEFMIELENSGLLENVKLIKESVNDEKDAYSFEMAAFLYK